MKKAAKILSLVIFIGVFLANCTTIEKRYTGRRIQTAPSEYEYRDYGTQDYYSRGYYYDPYDSFYFGPSYWGGFSFWNPFWYYGILGSYYWGYSPYYWGRGYYPYYRRTGYSPYRSTYRSYIRKDQLRRGRTSRSPSVRTKKSSKRSGYTTGIRSRSLAPARTRTSVTRTRTSSRTAVKKKK